MKNEWHDMRDEPGWQAGCAVTGGAAGEEEIRIQRREYVGVTPRHSVWQQAATAAAIRNAYSGVSAAEPVVRWQLAGERRMNAAHIPLREREGVAMNVRSCRVTVTERSVYRYRERNVGERGMSVKRVGHCCASNRPRFVLSRPVNG